MVMEHFDVLRHHIRQENGTIVKTIGDAVMAVFRQPDSAVRAMTQAQRDMDEVGVGLRVGMHTGRCIAVNLNDRLDYFGTTVNMAARLEGFSTGRDVIISDAVYADPAVEGDLQRSHHIAVTPFTAQLKGFPAASYNLLRVTYSTALETANDPVTLHQRS
ncbi:MAG: adenylate/guanylate cyclase domain-containing protein, partial [Chloroflexota bacterium]